MCEIRVITYASCRRNPPHNIRAEYFRCAAAQARPNQQPCLPPSGRLRDLPLTLDVQDTNVNRDCSVCTERSPTNFSDWYWSVSHLILSQRPRANSHATLLSFSNWLTWNLVSQSIKGSLHTIRLCFWPWTPGILSCCYQCLDVICS